MEKQVFDSDEYLEIQEKRFSKSKKWALLDFSFATIFINSLLTGSTDSPLQLLFCTIGLLLCSSAPIYDMIDSKIKIKDISKNKMFVENEEDINESLTNPRIIDNTSFETYEIVRNAVVNKQPVTLNSIDKMKYKDLKQILENIKRMRLLGINNPEAYNDSQIENSSLCRELNNKKF